MAGSVAPEGLGETLIPAINKLQDIFNQVTLQFKLDLPQVAVIGSQSSGKSSVLEALVGRDFLPRGPEICTRRPLVLQLVKQPMSSAKAVEWGEFLHRPGKRFTDFEEIRQEIQAETDKVTGVNKGVSDKPIRLKIFSPDVLTMTLVDLPGIARVPVGDQPTDIEERIRKMILEYIHHPTCLILAVSPSNADLVNSDAISMARTVDPEGLRTIGVLTKLDIMDRGTDAASVLKNEVVPLRLGYIGVVNRSQQDINTKRSMSEARAAEAEFFSRHPEYAEVGSQCGTANLARTLNRILVEHIRSLLPNLRSAIEDALDKRAAELMTYGEAPVGDTNASRGALLLQLLDAYSVRYTQMLEGCSEHMPVTELAGGARIRHIFQDVFMKGLDQLNPSSELSDEDVRTAIKNSGGVKGTLLIPDVPFELLVRRAISCLLTPALQCKDFVHGELLRIAGQCAPPDIARFPALQSHLMAAVEDFIDSGAGPAERMIRDLVECEHAYINTDHPQFIGGSRAISMVMERRARVPDDSSEEEPSRSSQSCGDLQLARHAKANGSVRTQGAAQSSGQGHGTPDGRHRGRVPLAEASNNSSRLGLKTLRTSVRAHPLKGVEPELYNPEELLGGDRAPVAAARPLPDPEDHLPSSKWFTHWFGLSDARATASSDSRNAALNQPPFTLRVQDSSSEQEEVQVEVTRLLVECYFDIVRKNLQDAVPKAIMHFLVLFVQRGLQQRLIRTLYREDLFAEMMSEREDIASRREACQKMLQALHSAMATLDSLPQTLLLRVSTNTSGYRPVPAHNNSLHVDAPPIPFVPRTGVDRHPALSGAARMAVTAMATSLKQDKASASAASDPFKGF